MIPHDQLLTLQAYVHPVSACRYRTFDHRGYHILGRHEDHELKLQRRIGWPHFHLIPTVPQRDCHDSEDGVYVLHPNTIPGTNWHNIHVRNGRSTNVIFAFALYPNVKGHPRFIHYKSKVCHWFEKTQIQSILCSVFMQYVVFFR